MSPDLIDLYTGILTSYEEVTFEDSNRIFRIWWSDGNEGWYIEVLEQPEETLWYPDLKRPADNAWNEVDGGLCTGSARDAVEFML